MNESEAEAETRRAVEAGYYVVQGDYSDDDPWYEGPPIEMWWPPYGDPERHAEQLLTGQEP